MAILHARLVLGFTKPVFFFALANQLMVVLGRNVCHVVNVPLADSLLKRCGREVEGLGFIGLIRGFSSPLSRLSSPVFCPHFWYMFVCLFDVHRSAFPVICSSSFPAPSGSCFTLHLRIPLRKIVKKN